MQEKLVLLLAFMAFLPAYELKPYEYGKRDEMKDGELALLKRLLVSIARRESSVDTANDEDPSGAVEIPSRDIPQQQDRRQYRYDGYMPIAQTYGGGHSRASFKYGYGKRTKHDGTMKKRLIN